MNSGQRRISNERNKVRASVSCYPLIVSFSESIDTSGGVSA